MSTPTMMPPTELMGLSQLADTIPTDTADLKRGRNWRELVAQQPPDLDLTLSPQERRLLLRITFAVRRVAVESLRQSVLNTAGSNVWLHKPEPMMEGPPPIAAPTAGELAEYAGVVPLQRANEEDIETYDGHDRGTLQARLSALHTDARAEVDENVVALRELVVDYCASIRTDRKTACQALEEIVALVGRTAVLMKRQNPSDRDGRRDAVRLLIGGVREMFGRQIERTLVDLPDDTDRRHFITEARGTLDLFMGKQANRIPS